MSSVQDVNYGYSTRQEISTKLRACEQLQKFCEHSSNFCEQFEQRQNFASTFKSMGPFDTPHIRQLNHQKTDVDVVNLLASTFGDQTMKGFREKSK